MIPILYDKTGGNRIGFLEDCIKCEVVEERNGEFELTLIYPSNSALLGGLEKENIIVSDANDFLKNQKFRIYNTRKLMSNRIEVRARHISFDLAHDWIDTISIDNQPCEYVLNTIFRNSQHSTHYRGYSDIVMSANYSMNKANCIEAIGGKTGSILDTFGNGAEILRDNTDIHILNNRGHDNEVSIEYRKNLTGLTVEEDTTDLVTRIRPYAVVTDNDGNEVETMGNFIDSPLINNYAHPYVKYIDYSSEFDDENTPTVAKLHSLAVKEYEVNKIDIPKLNYKIEFVPLSKCAGYEGLEDRINLCDTVTIRDTRYNIDTQAKVIKVVYNVLRDRYDKMELGEPRTTLGDVIGGSNTAIQGPPGPPGPQGPAGADGSIGDFPNTLPSTPVITSKLYGFASVELSWTFENKVYYSYELYASKTKGFNPNTFNLIFSGQASTFLHQVKPDETWYYRVCAVNSHGQRTEFSEECEVKTIKIDDLSNYVENAAIGDALIGTLSLDRGWVGQLKGNWIDAKQLSVTDGNGKRTLNIDSFGNVDLDVTNFKVNSTGIADYTRTLAFEVANTEISNINIGANNLLLNSSFEYGTKYWDISNSDYIFPTPNGYDGGQCLKINGSLNATRTAKNTCSGLIPDTEYTFSGYIRTMDLTPGATNYLLGFIITFFKNGNWMDEIYCREPSTGTHWFKKRAITFRTPSYDQCDTVVISCYGRDFTGSVWFDHLKLTQGNKESDWSPAPVELADRITDTEASIKINADNIALKASKTDVQNLTNRVTTAESSIKVNTDNIALKASKTDVQNLTNRVTTAESKITDTAITNVVKSNFYTKDQADSSFATQTQLEQTATGLTATIAQSKGYNELLNGSFDTRDFSNWTVTASDAGVTQHATTLRYRARVKCISGVNRGFRQTVRLQSGEWYTVSTNVVVDSGVVAGLEVSYNGKYFGARTNDYAYFSKGVLHYTFQADENTDANVLFYVDGKTYGNTGAGGNAYFYYVQLEKGQIATTFSPHPNEIYTTNAIFDKNGLRVNQTNVGTYTQMNANGFFVMKNNGNVLFEATDKIALYDGKGLSCVTIVNDPNASYGNAKIDLRGGINFIHNTGVSVGTNQILLGNDDRADKYGLHNLSVRAHNSLGFQDNNGYTNMYFATRTGRIIMKGALYQNTSTPPSAFFLSTDENDDLYFSGYTKQDMIDAILELDTQIQVDHDEDYTMKICPSENDLITTMIGDQPHIDQSSLIAGLVETVKMLKSEIDELKKQKDNIKTEF